MPPLLLALLLLLACPCLAAPPPQPQAALLWECSAARSAWQAWTQPTANGTIALASAPAALALTLLGWPAFAYNVELLSAGPAAAATPLAFNASAGSLVAPSGACLGALYGVAFHGVGLAASAAACAPAGAGAAWAYSALDGTLRPAANASLCLDFGGPAFSCSGPEGAGLLYCDASSAPQARAADLAARLSASEAAYLLSSGIIVQPLNYGTNLGLPARGLPPLWWGECCHGAVAACGEPGASGGSGCPTSLPAGLAMGASLNASAWRLAGALVSTEARALYNQGLHGLGCFAPNINPFRAPQWGRGAETTGEDAHVNGQFGAAFAGALQGEGEASVLRVLATIKHAVAYDQEDSDGTSRASFDARVSQRDLAEYFWAPFKPAAQVGRAAFLMTAYNAVNGVPNAVDGVFLGQVLRGAWGWRGATVTDCGGLQQVQTAHHYANSSSAALSAALGAGLDSECGDWFALHGAAAVGDGSVALAQLQAAAQRTLAGWFAAGLLPSAAAPDPYAHLGGSDVDTAAARALALELALQGAVLLRNAPAPGRGGSGAPLLPLGSLAGRTVALIGPQALAAACLLGPYSAPASAVAANNTLAAALARRAAAEGFALRVAPGCNDTACADRGGFAAALAAARGADVVLAAFGLCGSDEGEGHDRRNLTLSQGQEALLAALGAAAAASAAPAQALVLVLVHGGPLALQAAADPALFPAILTLHYPGQAGGEAAVQLLTGDVSPSGRTTMTWYAEDFNAARRVTDMQLAPHGAVPGVTYRWFGGTPLFEFGLGGSYTTFSFSWADSAGGSAARALPAAALASGALAPPSYAVNVTNTGAVTSDVSVLAFVSSGAAGEPLRELFDFGRLARLAPGETRTLLFTMDLGVLGSGGRGVPAGAPPHALALVPGVYSVRIGDVGGHEGSAVEAQLTLLGEGPSLLL